MMWLWLFRIITLSVAVSFLSLGIFVYLKSSQSKLHRSFFVFNTFISFWSFGFFLTLLPQLPYVFTLWSSRISHFCGGLTAVLFLRFVIFFLGLDLKKLRDPILAILAFGALTSCILPWMIVGLKPKLFFPYYPEPGPLYFVFLANYFYGYIKGFYFLFRAYRDKEAELQQQMQAILTLSAVLIGWLSIATLFLPIYNIQFTPLLGFLPVFVIVFVYAIIRYKFLDVEVIIKRTLVFAGLAASVMMVVSLIAFVSQDLLVRFITIPRWFTNLAAAGIIAATYGPLRSWLVNVTDRYLFQKKYDYRELLRVFTNEILTVLDLQKLTEQTVAGLNNIIKLESTGVLLHDKETKTYKLAASLGVKERNIILKEDNVLINLLKASNQHILHDKEADKMEGGALKETFKRLNTKLCLPIELHDDLVGIICLGMKKSGEDYTQEDIDILTTLARTEAIAISNAQLFDELSKTQAEAAQREKMAVIGTLAAGINHEICNPLGIVRGQCEMFLLNMRDGFYDGKSREELLKLFSEILNKAIKETDRATAITKKLSSFAKPPSKAEREEVFVEKEVDEVISLIGHDMKLNNIELQKDFPNNFPLILADKKQIQEVLFNIIRNAAQAIDETKKGRILVTGFSDNGTVVVRIADNGSGIPQEKIQQIFHPFYTTKAPGKGTGLGLFIVKQVVERNQGTIAVESEYGVGTTFTLRFPTAMHAITHS